MSHYFEESPSLRSAPVEVEVRLADTTVVVRSDRGVFSHGRLDPGTALLLRRVPAPPDGGALLDLGCGAGAIALVLARRAPRATVWAIDVNERARQLCSANAERNSIDNVVVARPDEVPGDVRFDAVWSNPPIRIGKPALHALLATWLDRLTPFGTATLVVHRHLGGDSLQRWLAERGNPTTRLASSKGYRLLHVVAG